MSPKKSTTKRSKGFTAEERGGQRLVEEKGFGS